MQYTIRQIPKEVDLALRARARAEGKSLNETAVEILSQALDINAVTKRRDLSDLAGSMTHADAQAIRESVKASDRFDLGSQKRSRR